MIYCDNKYQLGRVVKDISTTTYKNLLILGTDFSAHNNSDDVFSHKKIYKNIELLIKNHISSIKNGDTKLIFFFIDFWGTKTIYENDNIINSGGLVTYNIYEWLYPQLKNLNILDHCVFVTSLSLDNVKKYHDFKIIYWNYSFNLYLKDKYVYPVKRTFNKKFFWLNRRPREHRIYALNKFIEKKIIDNDVIYTFLLYDENKKFNLDYINQILNQVYGLPPLRNYTLPPEYDIEKSEFVLYQSSVLDNIVNFTQGCWLEVISEYNFSNHTVFHDEKIAKSIILKNPFVVIGDRYFLREFQKLGFKTFNTIWSEEYDTLPTIEERIECISNLLIDIFKKHNWKEAYSNAIQNILDHNYNHYYGEIKTKADNSFKEIFS